MEFKSVNPYNNEQVGKYTALTEDELDEKLNKSQQAFESWK
jgi:succinate-semialdehyde dehydrogenase/glutarate-semialdehyde dehydrogenase